MRVNVENSLCGFTKAVLNGNMMTPVMILGSIILLILIGRQSLIRLIFYLFRGALYLFAAALVIYIVRYYPGDFMFHARRFWADLNNIFGLG